MGLFVVFEGIEGCGKSTQIQLLGSWLERKNIDCIITREPGGTATGEAIRKIFLHSDNRELTPLAELLLVTAARVQHVCQVIRPALDKNRVVVCDRFFDATVAYQGYAGGVTLDLIEKTHALFLDSITPDLTILLDCRVPVGLERSRSRNRAEGKETAEGRFEDKTVAFHEKVRRGYLERAARETERFRTLDAGQPVEAVHREVCGIVVETLRGRGYAV